MTQEHLDHLRNLLCVVYYWMWPSTFSQLDKNVDLSRKRKSRWKKLSHEHVCGIFFWLMIHVEGPRPLWELTLLGMYLGSNKEKETWANHRGQISKQCFSMGFASILASRFLLWAPALAFLSDKLWNWRDGPEDHFLLQFCSDSTLAQ